MAARETRSRTRAQRHPKRGRIPHRRCDIASGWRASSRAAGDEQDRDGSGREAAATALHGRIQAPHRARGRPVHDAGGNRRVAAARGAVLLAPDYLARRARSGGTGGADSPQARAEGGAARPTRQEDRRARARDRQVEEAPRCLPPLTRPVPNGSCGACPFRRHYRARCGSTPRYRRRRPAARTPTAQQAPGSTRATPDRVPAATALRPSRRRVALSTRNTKLDDRPSHFH